MGFTERNTYFTQSTSFEDQADEGRSIRLTRRQIIDGKRRFTECDGVLLERSGPIQVGPSEAMYVEYALVQTDGDVLGIAYQAKDAMAKWSGWELSEEIGVVDKAQGLQRLKVTVDATDRFSGAGRGTGSADPEGW